MRHPMNWYYIENDQQRGPVSGAELAELARQGTVRPETFVWREGLSEWQPYGQVTPTSASSNLPPPKVTEAAAVPVPDPDVACSRCGAEVPRSQTITVGTMTLCPKCQVGYERQLRGELAPPIYASPVTRLLAFVLDSIFSGVVVGVFLAAVYWLATNFFPDRKTSLGIMLIGLVCALLWIVNYYVGRIAKTGATPGMRLFRLRVTLPQGGPVGTGRALARFLVLGLVNSVTAGLGHLVTFFHPQKRSLHDLLCGTLVVKG